jgi:hypothetical protein
MSDEDISMSEHAIDAAYDLGYGVGAVLTGEFDEAADRFLDASSSALDAITDGGFSHLVDRIEGDLGIDLRETVEDGVQWAGEALGDAAWEATEAVGDAVDWVAEGAEDIVDTVGDVAEEAYDTVADAAGDVYDEVAGWFE